MTSGETTAALLSVSAEVLPAQRDIRRLIDGRWALWIEKEGMELERDAVTDGKTVGIKKRRRTIN